MKIVHKYLCLKIFDIIFLFFRRKKTRPAFQSIFFLFLPRICFQNSFYILDLETIDDDAEKSNIKFVKINDKRFGKSFGIKKFPALSFFRERNIVLYQGDLKVTGLEETPLPGRSQGNRIGGNSSAREISR